MSDLILKSAKQVYSKTMSFPSGHSIWIRDGLIHKMGPDNALGYPDSIPALDCSHSVLIPGFVDCHTHLLFAGSREHEFYMRAAGRSYLEILESGGGIYSTVNALRSASDEELIRNGLRFLDRALALGTTTVEIKSGYGLDPENEMRMLSIIRKLDNMHAVDIIPTFLTHTVPRSWERERYLETVEKEMIPAFREYSEWYDIFIEKGVFSAEESRRLLRAAHNAGYHLGVHANQVHDIGGVTLAIEMNVRHISHLEVLSDKDAAGILENDNIYPVFLPGAEACVFSDRKGQIGRLLSIPERLILSTDFNPGSSPLLSPALIMQMAVLRYRSEDAAWLIDSFTRNPADMLYLSDRGRLEVGCKADIISLKLENYEQLPYFGTMPVIDRVIKTGKVVCGV